MAARRPKKELLPKANSAFIGETVKAKRRPDRNGLNAAYKAAAHERWRLALVED